VKTLFQSIQGLPKRKGGGRGKGEIKGKAPKKRKRGAWEKQKQKRREAPSGEGWGDRRLVNNPWKKKGEWVQRLDFGEQIRRQDLGNLKKSSGMDHRRKTPPRGFIIWDIRGR